MRLLHPLNISLNTVTFCVSKPLMFSFVRLVQKENIEVISVTLEVLKPLRSRLDRFWQL